MAHALQPVADDVEPFDPANIPLAVQASILEVLADDEARAAKARDLHSRLQAMIGAELADVVARCIEGHQGPPAPWGQAGVRREHNRNGLLLDAIEELMAARASKSC